MQLLNIPKLQRYLNFGEFVRTLASAHVAAGLVAVGIAALRATAANLPAIVPDPLVAFIVAQALGALVVALGKFGDGQPVAIPPQAPAVVGADPHAGPLP